MYMMMLYFALFLFFGKAFGSVNVELVSGPPDACDLATRPREINSTNGEISSPNPYDANTLCEWRITAPNAARIYLDFQELDIDSCAFCGCDAVQIYDGADDTGTLLGTFCDPNPPPGWSNTNTVFVRFTADDNPIKVGTGFRLQYNVAGGPGTACTFGGGTPEIMTESSGTISSPNYPLDYPFDTNCGWSIQAPEGQRVHIMISERMHFETVCFADYLEVFDGASITAPRMMRFYDRDFPSPFLSSSNQITFNFISDGINNRPGFRLSWIFVNSTVSGLMT